MESMLGRFELTMSFCNQHCCFPGPKFRTKNKEICLGSWDITVAQTKMKLRLLGIETATQYSPLHLARTTVVAIIFDAGDHPALSHWFHVVCQRTLTLIWKHKPKNISSETLQTRQNLHSTIKQILLPKPYILEIICAAGGCYHHLCTRLMVLKLNFLAHLILGGDNPLHRSAMTNRYTGTGQST